MADDKRRAAVGRQIHLPLGRAFLISVKSIRIRFWRSMITAAGIFLGIAFLVSVLTQVILQAPPTPLEIVYPNVFVRGVVKRHLDKPMEPGLTAQAAIEAAGGYADGSDRKNVTVVKKKGDKVVLDFTNPATINPRLEGGDTVFVPNASGRLRQLIVALVALIVIIVGLVAIKRIDDRFRRVAASVGVVALGVVIFAVGLAKSGLTPPKAPQITVIQSYHVRGEVNIATDTPAVGGKSVAYALEDAGGVTKGADGKNVLVIRKGGKKMQFDMTTAAGRRVADATVLKAGDLVYVPEAATRNRRLWLVVVSLVVCTIGISNSMLMSVTERFKEIGTMKCLGALDIFVVELFLLEAGVLGIIASFAGWLVGFGVISLMAAASQGLAFLAQMTLMEVLRMLGIALAVGSVLTTVATIAPAIRAAQMPPAAALWVEV